MAAVTRSLDQDDTDLASSVLILCNLLSIQDLSGAPGMMLRRTGRLQMLLTSRPAEPSFRRSPSYPEAR